MLYEKLYFIKKTAHCGRSASPLAFYINLSYNNNKFILSFGEAADRPKSLRLSTL